MKLMTQITGAVLAAVFAFSAPSANANETQQALASESAIETIKKRGVIRVGI